MKKKLDKEHIDSIQEIKQEFHQITNIIGNISIDEYSINQQLISINCQLLLK